MIPSISKKMAIAVFIVAVAGLSNIAFATQEFATPESREMLFNNACRTCHLVKEGMHRLGPSLYGVIGRKAGSIAGYRFSSALSDSGIVWDEATIDKFMANPDAVAPGNNMKPYTALTSPEQRAAIITFLKEKSAGQY